MTPPGSIEIWELGTADAPRFRELRLKGLEECPTAFGASYAQEAALGLDEFERRLVKNDNRWVLGAFSGQALVGVVGFGREDSEKTRHRGHIWGMHVEAAWRRRGIGRALLAAVLSRTDAIPGLASVRLGVTSTNLGALNLYRSFGFGSLYTEDEYLFADGSYHSMHFMRRWSDASRRVTGDRAKDLPVA